MGTRKTDRKGKRGNTVHADQDKLSQINYTWEPTILGRVAVALFFGHRISDATSACAGEGCAVNLTRVPTIVEHRLGANAQLYDARLRHAILTLLQSLFSSRTMSGAKSTCTEFDEHWLCGRTASRHR